MTDALHAAARDGDLNALRAASSADLNAPDADGWTPLHLAAHSGRSEVVVHLIATGASVCTLSSNELANTPLHAALAGAQSEPVVAALLAAGADPNARAASGVCPLHLAASRGNDSLVSRLLDAGAVPTPMENGQTPADIAAERGYPALAEHLTKPSD